MPIFQIGKDIKGSLITLERATVGTSYDTAKSHTHPIGRNDASLGYDAAYGTCESIWIEFDNLLSSAATVDILICADANCDIPIFEATGVTLTLGVTTATVGTAQVYIGMPWYCGADTPNVYLVAKTDAGSIDIQKSQITWKL
jgi:hypothetical protein